MICDIIRYMNKMLKLKHLSNLHYVHYCKGTLPVNCSWIE